MEHLSLMSDIDVAFLNLLFAFPSPVVRILDLLSVSVNLSSFVFTGHSRCLLCDEFPTVLRRAPGCLFPLFKHDVHVGVLESSPGIYRGHRRVYSAFWTL